jgi:hypothetical protein
MEYKYTKNDNFQDFASGRVIYHMGGEPTFPVRLSLEIYERCLEHSEKKYDITLYDCCCGGAYMLTVLGLLKNDSISMIYGSDIDKKSLKLAEDNLSLLTKAGIKKREAELEKLYHLYGKVSHFEALQSIERIDKLITKDIKAYVFYQDIMKVRDLSFVPDIIITDVPYGNMVAWTQDYKSDSSSEIQHDRKHKEYNNIMDGANDNISRMMDAISGICGRDTIICICSDKKQKIYTDKYQRLEKQLIGKRKFEIFRKNN